MNVWSNTYKYYDGSPVLLLFSLEAKDAMRVMNLPCFSLDVN